jgi:hypothetical protein
MMFRQVVGVKAGCVKARSLEQTLAIEAIEGHIRYGFDVVKHPKLQRHMPTPLGERYAESYDGAPESYCPALPCDEKRTASSAPSVALPAL